MTAEQFERLKAELEDGFQGPRRAGRPLLLEGGLDWKPLSLSPKDMDFIAARNGAAREIALAFGVPPMLRKASHRSLYRNTKKGGGSGGSYPPAGVWGGSPAREATDRGLA
jgi:HK97 family phage portal protein